MLIRSIRYPVLSLGPGKRIGVWTSGCKHACPYCISEHYWDFDEKYQQSISQILDTIREIIEKNLVDGISISGGDPFYQNDLLELLTGISELGISDVLVYTGFTFEELKSSIPSFENYLPYIGVLIDGPYIEELNDGNPLRGSSNQRIIVIKKELEHRYQEYASVSRDYDFFLDNGKIVVVGIPPKGFYDILKKKDKKTG